MVIYALHGMKVGMFQIRPQQEKIILGPNIQRTREREVKPGVSFETQPQYNYLLLAESDI